MDEQVLINSIYESKKIKSLQTRFIFYLVITNIFTFLVVTLFNRPIETNIKISAPSGHKELVVTLRPQVPMENFPQTITLYSSNKILLLDDVIILSADSDGNGLFKAVLAVPENDIDKIIESTGDYFLAYPEHKTVDNYELVF